MGFNFLNRITVQDYLTGDALLGFRSNPCFLLYVRGGVSLAHERIQEYENSATNPIARPHNFERNRAAGRVGAGVNLGFSEHFGIGLDYIFTHYPRLRFFTPGGTDTRVHIHSHYVGVSGIFSF